MYKGGEGEPWGSQSAGMAQAHELFEIGVTCVSCFFKRWRKGYITLCLTRHMHRILIYLQYIQNPHLLVLIKLLYRLLWFPVNLLNQCGHGQTVERGFRNSRIYCQGSTIGDDRLSTFSPWPFQIFPAISRSLWRWFAILNRGSWPISHLRRQFDNR